MIIGKCAHLPKINNHSDRQSVGEIKIAKASFRQFSTSACVEFKLIVGKTCANDETHPCNGRYPAGPGWKLKSTIADPY